MLVKEAKWFRDRFQEFSAADMFPMLNVGCQSEEFRKVRQPWVDEFVFAPLRKAGHRVMHTDIRQAPGVDLVGNLLDPAFRQAIRGHGFRSVIFSNVLEHVSQPKELSEAVADCIPPGGLIFVSAPFRFPYHADPIDTMFRPDVQKLQRLFPNTVVERGDLLVCGNLTTYIFSRVVPNPIAFVQRVFHRASTPCEEIRAPNVAVWHMLPWLFRLFKISCVVARRST